MISYSVVMSISLGAWQVDDQKLTYATVGPGFAGFLTMFLLALATFFLIRSMVGHLRKVRYGPNPHVADDAQGGRPDPTAAAPNLPPAPAAHDE